MKSILSILLFIGLLYPSVTWAAGDTVQQEIFQYRFEQKVTLPSRQSFFQLEFDPALFANMDANLRDLRLFSGGKELGFTSLPVNEVNQKETTLPILNQGIDPSGVYSFEIQYPSSSPSVKEQDLKVFLASNPYFAKGELFGSTDDRTWKKLKDISLFSIQEQTGEISLTGIQYSYLKIAFRPPVELLPRTALVSGVQLIETTPIGTTDSSQVNADITAGTGEGSGVTSLVADLKYANRLSDQLIVQTDEQAFYRQVTLEGSPDGRKWNTILSTYIYRGTSEGDEKLTIPYPPRYDRYLRIKIENQDNPPLGVKGLQFRVYPQRILVKAPSNTTTFTIQGYFGNPRIQPPSYDVGNVLKETGWRDFPIVLAKEYQKNPLYDPNKAIPFTERYPYLLTIGLILVAAVVFVVLYRTIREVKK